MAGSAAGALVIGYGNPLRGDDGIGWHVANALAADPRSAGLRVISAHQLSPEHAEDLAGADVAVLVDAQVDGDPPPRPGHWVVDRIEPPVGATGSGPGAWSHHCTPESLAELARELYGRAATVVVVGVGVRCTDPGESLSPPLAAAVPSIVAAVLELAGGDGPAADPAGRNAGNGTAKDVTRPNRADSPADDAVGRSGPAQDASGRDGPGPPAVNGVPGAREDGRHA